MTCSKNGSPKPPNLTPKGRRTLQLSPGAMLSARLRASPDVPITTS